MQLGCLACPVDRHSLSQPNVTGPLEVFIDSLTNPEMIINTPGQKFDTVCEQCPGGKWKNGSHCEDCPLGRTIAKGIGLNVESCGIDPFYYLMFIVTFLALFWALEHTPLLVGWRIPVNDISLEEDR